MENAKWRLANKMQLSIESVLDSRTSDLTHPHMRDLVHTRRILMDSCLEYIRRRTQESNEPLVSDVQRYMLKKWRITHDETSAILKDLDEIGMIGSRKNNRIFYKQVSVGFSSARNLTSFLLEKHEQPLDWQVATLCQRCGSYSFDLKWANGKAFCSSCLDDSTCIEMY